MVGVLVEAGSRQLFALFESQFVHVELLPHREAGSLVVARTAKAILLLVGARARNVHIPVDIFLDLVHVHFLHAAARHTKRIRMCTILVIVNLVAHCLAHLSCKVIVVVAVAVRGPVPNVRFADAVVAETLRARHESGGRLLFTGVELRLVVIAAHRVVALEAGESTRLRETVYMLA
jgi:hypothetical protein